MPTEYNLNGLELHLLKFIAKRASTTKRGDLVRTIMGLATNEQLQHAIQSLTNCGFILQHQENEYNLSEIGQRYLNDFDLSEKELVFSHRYDLAIIKFLYEFGDAIHVDDFPAIIINAAPFTVNGSQELQFIQHLGFSHQMKQFVKEKYHYWSLTDIGRARYQHEFSTTAEPLIATTQPPSPTTKAMSHKPLVFIGSSSESREVAEAIIHNLENVCEFKLWTLIFDPSDFILDSLLETIQNENLDFAIILLTADDKVTSRNEEQMSPRDNVVFELGLAIGILGRNRVFMVRETSAKVKMPTDLNGINYVTFNQPDRTDLANQLISACSKIRKKIEQQGLKKAK